MRKSSTRLTQQSIQPVVNNERSAFFTSSFVADKIQSPLSNGNWTKIRIQPRGLLLAGSLLLVVAALTLGLLSAASVHQSPGLFWSWGHLFTLSLALVLGGLWYASHSSARTRSLTADTQREQLLHSYLDHMSSLPQPQSSTPADTEEVEHLTRAWTVLAFQRLDGERKGLVIRFLCEAGLLQQSLAGNLEHFDLKNTDLSRLRLNQVNFFSADLRNCDLSAAELNCADFKQADLGGACLSEAKLNGADLRGAILDNANLRGADLSGADLTGAILDGANLRGANLNGAVLDTATLLHATFSPEQLEAARSYIGLIS